MTEAQATPDGIKIDDSQQFKILEQCDKCGYYKTWGFTVENTKTGKQVPGHVTADGFKIGDGDCPFYANGNTAPQQPAAPKPAAKPATVKPQKPSANIVDDLLAGIKPKNATTAAAPEMTYDDWIYLIAEKMPMAEDDARKAVKLLATQDDTKLLPAAIKYAEKNGISASHEPATPNPPACTPEESRPNDASACTDGNAASPETETETEPTTTFKPKDMDPATLEFIINRINEIIVLQFGEKINAITTGIAGIKEVLAKPVTTTVTEFSAEILGTFTDINTTVHDILEIVKKPKATGNRNKSKNKNEVTAEAEPAGESP
jgi:hypothetical protein